MFVTLAGIVTDVRLLQEANAHDPIYSKPSSRLISRSSTQFMKAVHSIFLTLRGSAMPVTAPHSLNACEPMVETPSGMTTDVASFSTTVVNTPSSTVKSAGLKYSMAKPCQVPGISTPQPVEELLTWTVHEDGIPLNTDPPNEGALPSKIMSLKAEQ